MMQIPGEEDWAIHNAATNLDYCWGKENFFGKNLAEAEEMFIVNDIHWQGALIWMPMIPFQYYIHAYINYLLSDKSRGSTDGASCFIHLIESTLKWNGKEEYFDCWQHVAKTQEHIRTHPEKYGGMKIGQKNIMETLKNESIRFTNFMNHDNP